MKINTVTVIGANGTMGRNVSAIFASFGVAKVYMVSRDIKKSRKAIEKAIMSVRADSIKDNFIAADFSMLEECVKESDLIFESVAENEEIKKSVNERIAKVVKKETIICSGTSGLSLTKLAESFNSEARSNYCGLHMFNPPYNMILCEVIPTKYTDRDMLDGLKEYATDILKRTVVEVKDEPAFLGNRIGFYFINEAMKYAEIYKDNGGIDYIDAILGPFTGRTMAPLVTSDFVGLDVHKAIIDNLWDNTSGYGHNAFETPDYLKDLLDKKAYGRKSGEGLYKTEIYDNGVKVRMVYDINSKNYRRVINYTFPYVEEIVESIVIGDYDKAFKVLVNNCSLEAKLCTEFLLKYIVYSVYSAKMVGYDMHSADDVMATGFNWCPPLALIEAFGGKDKVYKLVSERLDEKEINKINIKSLFDDVEKSKYDYRKFVKAKKR